MIVMSKYSPEQSEEYLGWRYEQGRRTKLFWNCVKARLLEGVRRTKVADRI